MLSVLATWRSFASYWIIRFMFSLISWKNQVVKYNHRLKTSCFEAKLTSLLCRLDSYRGYSQQWWLQLLAAWISQEWAIIPLLLRSCDNLGKPWPARHYKHTTDWKDKEMRLSSPARTYTHHVEEQTPPVFLVRKWSWAVPGHWTAALPEAVQALADSSASFTSTKPFMVRCPMNPQWMSTERPTCLLLLAAAPLNGPTLFKI